MPIIPALTQATASRAGSPNRRFIYALLSRIPHRLSPVCRKLYDDLMTKFTPIESEFATSDDAAAYDAWFRAKVERSLASSAPRVPHDEVMAMARKVIEKHTHE